MCAILVQAQSSFPLAAHQLCCFLAAAVHQAESDVFASTGGDRSIALYDMRSARPIRKLIMQTRSNALAWNPMEAFNFTTASEDCNLYTYDMRKLDIAACVHKVSWLTLLGGPSWRQSCCGYIRETSVQKVLDVAACLSLRGCWNSRDCN